MTNALAEPAARSLAIWYDMIADDDLGRLPDMLDPDAVFRSPMAFNPYRTAAAVALILRTASAVFEDFEYHRELVSEDGLNVALEFSAHIGDKQLKGIDLIRFDATGKIAEFEVMVRPMSGLQALYEQMRSRVGTQLAALST